MDQDMDQLPARTSPGLRTWLPLALPHALTTIGLSAMILSTLPTLGAAGHRLLLAAVVVAGGLIAAEFAYRLATAPRRFAYLVSADGLIDLAGALALPAGWLLVADPRDALLFAVVWTPRYIRNTTGLILFLRIIRRARTALLSIASLFLVIFLGAATLAYVFERSAQPEAFGSIPRVMWWAIVTLTTTGYGDVVPTTLWGRLLGGWIMVGGIVMFALQAGIIATAFAEELHRRHFLHTWDSP